MMKKTSKIGIWMLAVGSLIAFISRQKITFGLKGIYLGGVITSTLIPLKIVLYLWNKTVLGSVLVRSISGALVNDGKVIATVNQVINKRIRSNRYVEQTVLMDIHMQEALQGLFNNVMSGDISNLSFEFVGKIVVGEQYPIDIDFRKLFTWQDIQQIL